MFLAFSLISFSTFLMVFEYGPSPCQNEATQSQKNLTQIDYAGSHCRTREVNQTFSSLVANPNPLAKASRQHELPTAVKTLDLQRARIDRHETESVALGKPGRPRALA
jgi:hypothetical protein